MIGAQVVVDAVYATVDLYTTFPGRRALGRKMSFSTQGADRDTTAATLSMAEHTALIAYSRSVSTGLENTPVANVSIYVFDAMDLLAGHGG